MKKNLVVLLSVLLLVVSGCSNKLSREKAVSLIHVTTPNIQREFQFPGACASTVNNGAYESEYIPVGPNQDIISNEKIQTIDHGKDLLLSLKQKGFIVIGDESISRLDFSYLPVEFTDKAKPYITKTTKEERSEDGHPWTYTLIVADSPTMTCTGITEGANIKTCIADIKIEYKPTPIGEVLYNYPELTDCKKEELVTTEKVEYKLYDDGWRQEINSDINPATN